MTFHSAIYEGWVRHRRFAPAAHEFQYSVALMYLDLDELPDAFRGHLLWGHERSAVVAFHRADYLGDPRRPLREAVGDVVESHLGRRPRGAIRLLTHLRHFGYSFNPVSVYYCFDGERIDAIVLEVRNTPWGQRHTYVLDASGFSGTIDATAAKVFHVSPFLDMNLNYRFRITPPAENLIVHIDCDTDRDVGERAAGETMLDATLSLRRHEWNRSTLTRTLFRFPWMTGRVVAAIYWQALRLWWKRIPYVPNPHESDIDERTSRLRDIGPPTRSRPHALPELASRVGSASVAPATRIHP